MSKIFQGIDWGNKLPSLDAYTATDDDATANQIDIDSGKPGATGFFVQVFRDGVNVGNDVKASIALNGILTIEDGSSYEITTGDLIMWTVFM